MPAKKSKKRPRGGASVPCPKCGGPSRAIDTRRHKTTGKVLRNRECLDCLKSFASEEVAVA